MPFANLFDDVFRVRGGPGVWGAISRAIYPAADVMRGMGPVAGRLANEMVSLDDDAAKGVAKYMSSSVPLESWENIAPEKRILAAKAKAGRLRGPELQSVLDDPEASGLIGNLRDTFDTANQENLAVKDPQGNRMQSRNSWTNEWQDYQPIEEDYYPGNVRSIKRKSVVEPMQFVQSKLEQRLARDYIEELNKNLKPGELPLDFRTGLTPEVIGRAREISNAAIDDFFRTGTDNSVLKDPDLLKALKPAYETFSEIGDHLRQLQISRATKTGKPLPPEVDRVVQLFGSNDPGEQRQGIRLFREFLLRDAQQARRMGSIENTRSLPLPDDWYEWDPVKVVPTYLMRQQRRLGEIARFGQDNEAVLDPVNGLLKQIPDETDRAFVKSIFDRHMGLEPYTKSLGMNKLMDAIFATQVIKLGTAQISQLGQIMNSIMETGLGPTWQAMTDLGKSKNIAIKSGASLSRVMDIVREGVTDPLDQSRAKNFSENFLKWTGFNKADLIARHIGAGAGYAHGQEILRRAVSNPEDIKALREIRRLTPGATTSPGAFQPVFDKITAVRQQLGTKPTLEQIEQAFEPELLNIARTASLNANFRQSILDMPGWATTPLGRLVTMFRSFAYKQTGFVVRRALEDWRDGNPRTLVGLAAGAGVLGPLISTLKGIPKGTLGEEAQEYAEAGQSPAAAGRKALENIATVGALGLFDQMARAMRRGELGWFEFMGGPLFSDIANGLGGPGKIAAGLTGVGEPEDVGRGVRQAGRFAASHIPVIGGAVRTATSALTEDVTRHPSGLVTRGQTQVLGQESPPSEILGLQVPAPAVLFGLEQRVTAKRERYMDQLKGAITAGDMARVREVLNTAQKEGVRISATSVQRLLRQQREDELEAQRAQ